MTRPRLDLAKINELSDNAGHCVHNSVTGRKNFSLSSKSLNNPSSEWLPVTIGVFFFANHRIFCKFVDLLQLSTFTSNTPSPLFISFIAMTQIIIWVWKQILFLALCFLQREMLLESHRYEYRCIRNIFRIDVHVSQHHYQNELVRNTQFTTKSYSEHTEISGVSPFNTSKEGFRFVRYGFAC